MTTKLIELAVRCRRCRREWIPAAHHIRAGTWKVCPKCRESVETKEAA